MGRVMQRENRRLCAGGTKPLHYLFQGLPQLRDLEHDHVRPRALCARNVPNPAELRMPQKPDGSGGGQTAFSSSHNSLLSTISPAVIGYIQNLSNVDSEGPGPRRRRGRRRCHSEFAAAPVGCGASTAGTNCNCGAGAEDCVAPDACMLLIKSSTGMLGSGGALVRGTGRHIHTGLRGVVEELGVKKLPGMFSVGSGCLRRQAGPVPASPSPAAQNCSW
jgi:hypothetical protein